MDKCASIKKFLKTTLEELTLDQRIPKVKTTSLRGLLDACHIFIDNKRKLTLYRHQLIGVNVLLILYQQSVGGAILADEMGLGKSVTIIAYLAALLNMHDDKGPHLLVCRVSMLENWKREVKKWCPTLSILLYHGDEMETEYEHIDAILKAKNPCSKNSSNPLPFNIMLVGYYLFEKKTKGLKHHRLLLKSCSWSCVIMDDAHYLKDHSSECYKRMQEVACFAKQRIMITRTPVHNNLKDLWSLMAFLMPDVFTKFDINLKEYFDAKKNDLKLINNVRATLLSFVINRMKSDVMPNAFKDKFMRLEMLQMNEKHSLTYKKALEECKKSNKESETLNNFMTLRNAANHLSLIKNKEYTIETLNLSPKIQKLNNILLNLKKNGHRCLILSQGTNTLDILEWFIKQLQYRYFRYNNSNHAIVEIFNNDPNIFIFLFTIKDGRRGIALTSIDTIIFFDIDFNPQNNREVEDRVHRVGQQRPVVVYQLVTKGTIDEEIFKFAQNKLISTNILEDSEEIEEDFESASNIETMKKIIANCIK